MEVFTFQSSKAWIWNEEVKISRITTFFSKLYEWAFFEKVQLIAGFVIGGRKNNRPEDDK